MDLTQAKNILRSEWFRGHGVAKNILEEYNKPAIQASAFANYMEPAEIARKVGITVRSVDRNLKIVAAKVVEARGKAEINRWD